MKYIGVDDTSKYKKLSSIQVDEVTNAVSTDDVVTSPSPNKILKLDGSGKFPSDVIDGYEADYRMGQFSMSGGGTVTWTEVSTVKYVKWTQRFLYIPTDQETSTTGYIEIAMPSVSTVISGIGTTPSSTVTSDGIPLSSGTGLYIDHTTGSSSTSYTMYVANYAQLGSGNLDYSFLLVGSHNSDDESLKLGTGHTMPLGSKCVLGQSNIIPVTDLKVGDGTDSDTYIYVNDTSTNKPCFKYNHTSNRWEYSNNGTLFMEMGSFFKY